MLLSLSLLDPLHFYRRTKQARVTRKRLLPKDQLDLLFRKCQLPDGWGEAEILRWTQGQGEWLEAADQRGDLGQMSPLSDARGLGLDDL